jgi:hypothetical protein
MGDSFMCFRSVNVPQGATITYAVPSTPGLYITPYTSGSRPSGSGFFDTYGAAYDNVVPPASKAEFDVILANLTAAHGIWQLDSWVANVEILVPISPSELRDIVQEVVNRPGWISGNNLMIVTRQGSALPKYVIKWFSIEEALSKRARLYVEWTV